MGQPDASRQGTPALGAAALAAAALAAGAFVFHAWALFYAYPPVWPDEALCAQPAIALAREGVLSTDLLAGVFPGAERRSHLLPPGYYLFLAGVFAPAGASVEAMRLASLAAAAGAVGLTWLLGRAAGIGRVGALAAGTLLALDVVFLRGALIGRPDMVASALMLLTLALAVGGSGPARRAGRGRLFATGLAGGAATVVHPLGAAALLSVAAGVLAAAPHKRRALAWLAAGAALPLAGWAAYAASDLPVFAAQFGRQLLRKASRHPLSGGGLRAGLAIALGQHGMPKLLVAAVWAAGMAGLIAAARRRRDLLALPLCQALLGAAVAASHEVWYSLYLLPLTCLGLAELVARWRRPIRARAVLAAAAACLAAAFAAANVVRAVGLHRQAVAVPAGGAEYAAFCSRLGEALSPGATVLLCVVPDPYLGLLDRGDVTFRHFLPVGIPVDEEQYGRWMSRADLVVVGEPACDPRVERFVGERGVLAAEVDGPGGWRARVYRLAPAPAPARGRDGAMAAPPAGR